MADSSAGKMLSKQRRRRRILMNDGNEDDGTPSKIETTIQSESFHEFVQSEKTFASLSYDTQSGTTLESSGEYIESDTTFSGIGNVKENESVHVNTGNSYRTILEGSGVVENSAKDGVDTSQLFQSTTQRHLYSVTSDQKVTSYTRKLESFAHSLTEDMPIDYINREQYQRHNTVEKEHVSYSETKTSALSISERNLTKPEVTGIRHEEQLMHNDEENELQPMDPDIVSEIPLIHPNITEDIVHSVDSEPTSMVDEQQLMQVDLEYERSAKPVTEHQETPVQTDLVQEREEVHPKEVDMVELQPGQAIVTNEQRSVEVDIKHQIQVTQKTSEENMAHEIQSTQTDLFNTIIQARKDVKGERQPSDVLYVDGTERPDDEEMISDVDSEVISKRLQCASAEHDSLNSAMKEEQHDTIMKFESGTSNEAEEKINFPDHTEDSRDTLAENQNNLWQALEHSMLTSITNEKDNGDITENEQENTIVTLRANYVEETLSPVEQPMPKGDITNEIRRGNEHIDSLDRKIAQQESIPESSPKTAKRKLSDIEDEEDESYLESNTPSTRHVSVKRKVRLSTHYQQARSKKRNLPKGDQTKSRNRSSVFKTRAGYTENTSFSAKNQDTDDFESNSKTYQVVENISSTRKVALESSRPYMDHLFGIVETQTTNSGVLPIQQFSQTFVDHSDIRPNTQLERTRSSKQDSDPAKKYRVQCYLELSPVRKPVSSKLMRKWTSEPTLNITRPKTKRSKSLNVEKKTVQKQSSLVIQLKKPNHRPLAPAYSLQNLPFEMVIRNKVHFKLKKKRRKSYPLAKTNEIDRDVEVDNLTDRDIEHHEMQTEATERATVQLSGSYEAEYVEKTSGNEDYDESNKENYEVNVAMPENLTRMETSPLTNAQSEKEESTLDNFQKPRKPLLNVTPLTIRPRQYKKEPTHVVVKQQQFSDIIYGRIQSATNYKLHRAVTSEKPRDDIVIEETSTWLQPATNEKRINLDETEKRLDSDLEEGTMQYATSLAEEKREIFKYGKTREVKEQLDTVRQLSEQPIKPTSSQKPQSMSLLRPWSRKTYKPVKPAIPGMPLTKQEPNMSPSSQYPALEQEQKDERLGLNEVVSREEEGEETKQYESDVNQQSYTTRQLEPKKLEEPERQLPKRSEKEQTPPHSLKAPETARNEKHKKRRHKPLANTDVRDVNIFREDPLLSPTNDYSALEEEPGKEEREPVKEREAFNIQMYLANNDEAFRPKPGLIEDERTPKQPTILDSTDGTGDYPATPETLTELHDEPMESIPLDTGDGLGPRQPINVDRFLDNMVDRGKDQEDHVSEQEHANEHQRYHANDDIQKLLGKISSDEKEETVHPFPERFKRDIEVILVDETKKKKRKKSRKQQNEQNQFSETVPKTEEPEKTEGTSRKEEDKLLKPTTVLERHDDHSKTKEQAVQTTPEEMDFDSEDSEGYYSEFPQGGVGENFWINTIPEEEQDDQSLSHVPYRDTFMGTKMSGTAEPTDKLEKQLLARQKEQDEEKEDEKEEEKKEQKGTKKGEEEEEPERTEENLTESFRFNSKQVTPLQTEKQEPVKAAYLPRYLDQRSLKEDTTSNKVSKAAVNQEIKQGKTVDSLAQKPGSVDLIYQPRDEVRDVLKIQEPFKPLFEQKPSEHADSLLQDQKPVKLLHQANHPFMQYKEKENKPLISLSERIPFRATGGVDDKQAEPRKNVPKASYQVQDFVLEIQRQRNGDSLQPPPTKKLKRSAEPPEDKPNDNKLANSLQFAKSVEELNKTTAFSHEQQTEYVKSIFQPRYQRFITNDKAERNEQLTEQFPEAKQEERLLKDKAINSATPPDEDVSKSEEVKPIYQPRYEIRDFVAEDQPERKAEREQPLSVNQAAKSTAPLVENLPKPEEVKPIYQPRYEIRNFLIDGQPERNEEKEQPSPVHRTTKSTALLVEHVPEQEIKPIYQPMYDIQDFVIKDQPEGKAEPEQYLPVDKATKSATHQAEDVPKPEIKPVYQPRYEISEFVPEDQPERKVTQEQASPVHGTTKSAAPLVEDVPKPKEKKPTYQPTYEIRDFVKEDQPERKVEREHPSPVLRTTKSAAPLDEDVPKPEEVKPRSPSRYEIRDFVIKDQPERKVQHEKPSPGHRTTKSADPLVEDVPIPEEVKPTNQPRHEIRDFLIEDQSETKQEREKPLPVHRTTKSAVSLVEDMPKAEAKPIYQPRYEIRDFVKEDQPERKVEREHPSPVFRTTKSADPLVEDVPKPEEVKPTYQPRYEIRDFAIEDQPETKEEREKPLPVHRTTKSAVPLVEDMPKAEAKPIYQPRYEIRDFVTEDQQERKVKREQPSLGHRTTKSTAPLVEDVSRSEKITPIYQPTYGIQNFVIKDQPDGKAEPEQHLTVDKATKSATPQVEDGRKPEEVKPIYQPRYEIRDFIIKDHPEGKAEGEEPSPGHRATKSAAPLVDDLPKPEKVKTIYQSRYEIREFLTDDQPEGKAEIEQPSPVDKATKSEIPQDEDMPKTEVKTKDQQRYEIRKFVVQDEPKTKVKQEESLSADKAAKAAAALSEIKDKPETKRPDQVTSVILEEKEPEHVQPIKQQTFEIQEFVVQENKQRKEKDQATSVVLAEEKPEPVQPIKQPTFKIREFLVEEKQERKETDQATSVVLVEKETEPLQTIKQPTFEIREFVVEEEQKRKEPDQATSVVLVEKQPEPVQPIKQPTFEIRQFVVEEEPERKEPDQATSVILEEKQPEPVQPIKQPTFEIREFVVEEEPERKEPDQATSVVLADKEPEPVQPIKQPTFDIREFVVEDDLKRKEPEQATSVVLLEKEPEPVQPIKQQTFEIREFEVEKEPERKEPDQATSLVLVEKETEPLQTIKQPTFEIREFVVEEEQKRKEPDQATSVVLAEKEPEPVQPIKQPKFEIREFAVEQQPERKEPDKATSAVLAEKQPEPVQPINQQTFEIREFVVEEEPERKEPDQATSVILEEKQPEPVQAIKQPTFEIREFVVEEEPESKEPDQATSVVLAEKEPEPVQPIKQPTFDIREFVVEKEPERKEPDQATSVVLLEKEPEPVQPIKQPTFEIREFEVEKEPERKEPDQATSVVLVEKQPEPAQTIKQPTFQIRKFVVEKEPERKEPDETTSAVLAEKKPEPVQSIKQPTFEIPEFVVEKEPQRKEPDQATSVVLAEKEPEPVQPIKQPTFEIREFVVEDEPERKQPDQAASVVLVEKQPEPVQPIKQQTFEIREFVVEEKPERKEPDQATSVVLADKEPEPVQPIKQPTFEIREFVVEEEPERKEPDQATSVVLVEKQPEPVQPIKKPTFEIREFVVEEKPQRKEPDQAASVVLVEKQPEPVQPIKQPTFQIREFVVEDEPQRKEPDQATSVVLAEKEPEPVQPIKQPTFEIREFVVEEEQKRKEPDKATSVVLVEKQPEPVQPIKKPTFKIREFVVEEEPERKEPEKATSVVLVEEEPDPVQPINQPTFEIREFVVEEKPERKEPDKATPVALAEKEPEPVQPIKQPTFEIREFVVEEEPERKEPDEAASVVLVEKQPEPVQPIKQPTFEIREFVVKEEPQRKEPDQAASLVLAEKEPEPVQPMKKLTFEIREFVVEDEPQRKEPDQAASVVLVEKQPEPVQPIKQQTFEIREFVVEEKPERKEPDQATSVVLAEKEPEPVQQIKPPTFEIREFVVEEEPERKEPDQAASVVLVEKQPEPVQPIKKPTFEIREFVVEEKPQRKEPDQAASVVLVEKQPEPVQPIKQQTLEIREFVVEEEPQRKEPDQAASLVLAEKEPEPVQPIKQPTFEIREFVVEEEPERKEPDQAASVVLVEKQPEPVQPIKQPTFEIREFVVEEEPERKEPDQATPVVLAEKEPEPVQQIKKPTFEIREFVVEEDPKGKNIDQATSVILTENEPELVQQTKQLTFVIEEFETEEQPERKELNPDTQVILRGMGPEPVKPIDQRTVVIQEFITEQKPERQERDQDISVILREEESEPAKPIRQPTFVIQEFVKAEKQEETLPYQVFSAKMDTKSADPLVEDEAKQEQVESTDWSRHNIQHFVKEEQPNRKMDELLSVVCLEENELEPVKPIKQPRYEIQDFVLEGQQEIKEPQRPLPGENVTQLVSSLVEDEPDGFQPMAQSRCEIPGFIIEDQPQGKVKLEQPSVEILKRTEVPVIEQEPVATKPTDHPEYETRNLRDVGTTALAIKTSQQEKTLLHSDNSPQKVTITPLDRTHAHSNDQSEPALAEVDKSTTKIDGRELDEPIITIKEQPPTAAKTMSTEKIENYDEIRTELTPKLDTLEVAREMDVQAFVLEKSTRFEKETVPISTADGEEEITVSLAGESVRVEHDRKLELKTVTTGEIPQPDSEKSHAYKDIEQRTIKLGCETLTSESEGKRYIRAVNVDTFVLDQTQTFDRAIISTDDAEGSDTETSVVDGISDATSFITKEKALEVEKHPVALVYNVEKIKVRDLRLEHSFSSQHAKEASSKHSDELWMVEKRNNGQKRQLDNQEKHFEENKTKEKEAVALATEQEIENTETIAKTEILSDFFIDENAARDNSTTEADVWCSVKMKRWESDLRKENRQRLAEDEGLFSQLSSSTISNQGSTEDPSLSPKSSSRRCSTTSGISHKSQTSSNEPWISIRRTGSNKSRLSTKSDVGKEGVRIVPSPDHVDGKIGLKQSNSWKLDGHHMATAEQKETRTEQTQSRTNTTTVADNEAQIDESLQRQSAKARSDQTTNMVITATDQGPIVAEVPTVERSVSYSSVNETDQGGSKDSDKPWMTVKRRSTRDPEWSGQQPAKQGSMAVERITSDRQHVTELAGKFPESTNMPRFSRQESAVMNKTGPGTHVWFTVKMKRWESDLRKETIKGFYQEDKEDELGSEMWTSIVSNDGSFDSSQSSSRAQSPTSDISRKSESSTEDPRISVRKKNKTIFRENITQVPPLCSTNDDVSVTSGSSDDQKAKASVFKTLPWIEVKKRDSVRKRLSITKKKKQNDETLRGLHTSNGKDRLLLIKIPRRMLTKLETDEQMSDAEIEIPWMEVDPTAGEAQGYLPWVELTNQVADTDRLLMLKIPREMILEASKNSTKNENEIQLPWNDVVNYWEKTGQIAPGSALAGDRGRSTNLSLTLPTAAEQKTTKTQEVDQQPSDLPDFKLILPKKYCLSSSLLLKPMITVDQGKNITVRIKKSVKRKHNWKSVVRLRKSDRSKYSQVSVQDRWVILADGTTWWRLQVDDMDEFANAKPKFDGKQFENIYEIGNATTDERDTVNFNQFSKELGRQKKQFSFVINPKKTR